MRFYGFGNYYLSSLQQSLQAHHVCMEMVNDYIFDMLPLMNGTPIAKLDKAAGEMLRDWSLNHKTIVLLNGGNSADLKELFEFFEAGHANMVNPYPCASFNEDQQSLCGALTSVGIILPPEIYDTAADDRRFGMYDPRGSTIRRKGRPHLNDWQEELIVRLNQYGLAK